MEKEDKPTMTRRTAIQTAAALGTAAALTPKAATAADATPLRLTKGSTILFQGDSITDTGRDKKNQVSNNYQALGNGYAAMVAYRLLGTHADLKLQIHNRGISGNKVPDLQKRWQEDCIDLKPDVLSILIGVNDIWHKLSGKYDGTVEDYESGFTKLLADTKAALPITQLVICQPFALKCGAVNDDWYPEFEERQKAAKRVSDAAGAYWVPFQMRFEDFEGPRTPPSYWAGDGVHPTMAGHAFMAKTWLEYTGVDKSTSLL